MQKLAAITIALLVVLTCLLPSVAQADDSPLIGSWGRYNGYQDTVILTFLDNSHYLFIQAKPADGEGTSGLEYGTYTWNQTTGSFTATPIVDTNGTWGLSHSGTMTITYNGSSITWSSSTDGTRTVPLLSTGSANGLAGVWFSSFDCLASQNICTGKGGVLIAFINNAFIFAQTCTDDTGGQPGVEFGTYSWDALTGFFVPTIQLDTNGEIGYSHWCGTPVSPTNPGGFKFAATGSVLTGQISDTQFDNTDSCNTVTVTAQRVASNAVYCTSTTTAVPAFGPLGILAAVIGLGGMLIRTRQR